MINVFELDDLFDVLWHWRCSHLISMSADCESFVVGLQLFRDGSNADFVVFCNTIVLCSSLGQAIEDFWAVQVFGTWRIFCTIENSKVFLRN